jgi:hypothetical protein
MAGHSSTKSKGEGSKPPPNQRTTRKKAARREAFRELMDHAAIADIKIRLGVSTADALQECLDRAVTIFRMAAAKVDELPEDEMFEVEVGPNGATSLVPNRWRIMEDAARVEIERLAAVMTGLGIAERRVRIEEAMAQMLVAQIRDAALAVGIPHDQVRALGAALRDRVAEASTEVEPSPKSSERSQSPTTAKMVGAMGSAN